MAGLGDDFKELVRSSTNLVDLVSESVALKSVRGGTDFVGLCPFHDDRNPSFHVYPDRQTYRCWVCDTGGDCFRWVMETERVTFPEAIESLARRARLEIPKRGRNEQSGAESAASKANSLAVLEWAVGLLHQALLTGAAADNARRYVRERRLTQETVQAFRLGYHPEDWNWFVNQARGRFSPEQLVAAGLIRPRENGQGYSTGLTGRLVFPIFDERGRPVAFGGRVLPGSNIQSDAKYWNSPGSTTFQKSRTLYALDQARKPILDSQTVIVVEGYMDCIACHQAGIRNVVAPLGTALTEEHVRVLRRFSSKVVLTFDSDKAGRDAAEKSIARFIEQDMDLRILNVPSGKDPADFLQEYSAADFLSLAAEAPEAWEYKLRAVLARHGMQTIAGRQQVLNDMLDFLTNSKGMAGSVREDLILRNVCSRIQVDERTARQQLRELRNKAQKREWNRTEARGHRSPAAASGTEQVRGENALDRAERELLEIILTCPEQVELICVWLGPDDFENVRYQRLLALCMDLWKEDGELPELSRLNIAAESDSELLSLINAVVDAAEEKGIFRLMTETDDRHELRGGTQVPLHLKRVLHPLLERREKRLNLVSKQQLAQSATASGTLDDDTKDALRRLTSFRQSQMGHPTTLK